MKTAAQSLPVFVFPSQLQFVVGDPSTHKQVLTLYNPYEFSLDYKVLCTSPLNYSVVEPGGCIRPKCSVDVVVRHQNVSRAPSKSDIFRVNVTEKGNKEASGCKDVPSTLVEESSGSRNTPSDSHFSGLTTPTRSRHDSLRVRHNSHNHSNGGRSSLMLVCGFVCIVALSLPTHSESQKNETNVPLYLHLTVPQKLVAAYALGLITALIFKIT